MNFSSGRTIAAFYMLSFCTLVIITAVFSFKGDEKIKEIQKLESEIRTVKERAAEIENAYKACTSTLQSCLSSCENSDLLEIVEESLRIKR